MAKLTNFDTTQALEVVWNALHFYITHGLCIDLPEDAERWDDICTAMAWIEEALTDDE